MENSGAGKASTRMPQPDPSFYNEKHRPQFHFTRGWFPPDDNRALSLVTERNTIRLISMQLRTLKSAWRA